MKDQSIEKIIEVYSRFQRDVSVEWNKQVEYILSSSQASILQRLEQEGPHRITDLAKILKITPGAVTGLSRKLLANKLATRNPDEKDKRVVYLEITKEGQEVLKKYNEASKETLDLFFQNIPKESINQLIETYELVIQNIKKNS